MSDDKVKQVIVVRKDLKMPVGKVAAQVAHAAMAFMTRDPEMYIKETTCLKHEETDTLSLVGVGPNPLNWRVTHNPCIEYSEPTLRINPAYLEWAASERAQQAAREQDEAEDEAYYEDEDEE